tara:strand:+ start:23625 stop:23786 length:162 start_codon:yes stop_codon:yes gene_type:complete
MNASTLDAVPEEGLPDSPQAVSASSDASRESRIVGPEALAHVVAHDVKKERVI